MNEKKTPFNETDLKIRTADIKWHVEKKETIPVREKEKELSGFESVKILLVMLAGYVIYAILPTLFFVKVMDYGFWTSQIFTFVVAIILVFALGLHKEASPEQLAKRDMRKKH